MLLCLYLSVMLANNKRKELAEGKEGGSEERREEGKRKEGRKEQRK